MTDGALVARDINAPEPPILQDTFVTILSDEHFDQSHRRSTNDRPVYLRSPYLLVIEPYLLVIEKLE